MMVRLIADPYIKHLETAPALPVPTKEAVAVVGGGPSGLICAYDLSKRGYRVTIFEREDALGGAMRYIPRYRLPQEEINSVIDSLVRIGHIQVRLGAGIGEGGKTLDDLKKEGYRAIFIATGTPSPRPLTFEHELVASKNLKGVMFGLNLLYEVLQGNVPLHCYQGRKVIVIGGGNVAFDVARTVRRLGGSVTLVCLESDDKSSRDGIPADEEEIEGAAEEGIEIVYSRGVEEIIGEDGDFKKIKCPRCISVFDAEGRFSPRFDRDDLLYLEGDVLLVTIGQGPLRSFFDHEGLLDPQGRVRVDLITLMSTLKQGVFIGGDVRRIGFASEAMRDGLTAAESIDRYIRGKDMKAGRTEKEYEAASIPKRIVYKLQPHMKWRPAEERLNFEPFEMRFTPDEVLEEVKRCLFCGPCKSCKACIVSGLQTEIPDVEVHEDLCSGCGVCVAICPYEASTTHKVGERTTSTIDELKCKRCGVCITVCPSNARAIKDGLPEVLENTYAALSKEGGGS
jgi:NADPH-dependent glutamate synthase beta subunit-like oxidoreductase